MAQLPPKVPNMEGNWLEFSHQKIPTLVGRGGLPPNAAANYPSWVDEFLDFSSSRRGSHRRSVSDSIAYLEMPILDECRGSATNHDAGANNEFDRFDDDQFMSMFTGGISSAVGPTVSSSNPSTPSDHNSIDDGQEALHNTDQKHQKNESDEVQSHCKPENQAPYSAAANDAGDRITDHKRVKRILANRQSAQRSRVRKLQYISELERSVTSLQAEVSVLAPRVAFLDHQRLLLNVDNSTLKQRIAALAQDKIFKNAHQEALKKEIERLRQVYHQQNLKKIENIEHSPPCSDSKSAVDKKENLLNV